MTGPERGPVRLLRAGPPSRSPPQDGSGSDRLRGHLAQGQGAKVAKFTLPEGDAAIAEISCKCRSNFAIWAVDSSGDETDLLVNTIGNYAGTVMFSEYGEEIVAFSIEADAAWSILVRPVIRAPAWNGLKALSGEGDAVYRLTPHRWA